MTKVFQKIVSLSLLSIFIFVPALASAHHPPAIQSEPAGVTKVVRSETSNVYYGELAGEPHVYVIEAEDLFNLYINIWVPDIEGQKKDVSAAIIKNGNTEEPLAVLDGANFEWTKLYEPFGADNYFVGPEYKAVADAGTYEIIVWSSNNDSKYSLAIGEVEDFGLKETWGALTAIPLLKQNFFEVSPITFIRSPLALALIVAMYLLAAIFGFTYRAVLKRLAKGTVRGVNKNIGKVGRLVRFAIGALLLTLAITTTWSPLTLFFSGFAIFEALFSWCGFYAAIGKNSCPVG